MLIEGELERREAAVDRHQYSTQQAPPVQLQKQAHGPEVLIPPWVVPRPQASSMRHRVIVIPIAIYLDATRYCLRL